MGTQVRISVSASSRAIALRAAEAALEAIEDTEARLSTWRDSSELSRLNGWPVDQPFVLSEKSATELAAALYHRGLTRRAFDPGVGPLVQAWGLRSGGRLPGEAEAALALSASEPGGFRLEGTVALRLHPAYRIEEGGFGKGAALDRALDALAAENIEGAWIDLGGQVAVTPGRRTEVALAHPDDRTREIALLEIDSGSVATTGNSERGFSIEGTRFGHVLDPRTGRPAEDLGSVTVWAPTALAADCLSTGLFVMGGDAALDWAGAHPGIEIVVLEREAETVRVRTSRGLGDRVTLVPGPDHIQGGNDHVPIP